MFAKIISTYPAPDTSDQCFFVIQYSVDGITYQKKFLDKTFGLLSTEKFLEVVINDDDPKDAALAVEVDHYNTHGPRKSNHLLCTLNFMILFLPLLLLLLECTPTLPIHLLRPSMYDQCSKTKWIDALAHYLVILVFYPFQQFLDHYIQRKIPVETQAVALNTVTKPIVPPPQTYNDVFDQSILLIPPSSHHRLIYVCTACLFFGLWFLYGLSKYGISLHKTCLFIIMFTFTSFWAYFVTAIITKLFFVEPLRMQFQEEGLPLKNMTVLKSGGPDICDAHFSIIQYEADVINDTGISNNVRVQACIYGKDLDSLLVLPMQPMSICTPEPPKMYTVTICTLLASPLGCISFYDWNANDTGHEKCVFALVTTTLCFLGAMCIAIKNLDILDAMTGKSREVVIVSDGNKLT